MESNGAPKVDQSQIRVNQASMILVLLVGFIFDLWYLVAAVAVINILGVLSPKLLAWRWLYRGLLKPLGLVRPDVIVDHPEPHRFAMAVGGGLATLSTVLLLLGLGIAGWVVAWILMILAGLNLFLGFCLGCFTYYQLNRLGVPGFEHSRMEGV
jgi:hypothetical protein